MIIFTDIDDTLMKTTRKMTSLDKCIIGAFNNDNNPSSYIDPMRQKIISNLFKNNTVIPVTARSYSAISRVTIHFAYEKIINFGGTILNKDNSLNIQWADKMNNHFLKNDYAFIIADLKLFLSSFISQYYEIIERVENDLFIFLNLRNQNLDLQENINLKNKLECYFLEQNIHDLFYIYVTDRDITIIPNFIKKENAVIFVKEKYPTLSSIGMGDHTNDLEFMKLCDFTLYPNDSLISQKQ